tara:strand:+ start:721 stop:1254 length:534 start_codon:yes stop_codon:yes gene_type:complete
MKNKTLFLLRHAKSDLPSLNSNDFNRPLTKIGNNSAKIVGKHIAELQNAPALIICSASKRTVDTAKIAIKEFKSEPTVSYEKELYEADEITLLTRIKKISEKNNNAMIIGHQPTIQNVASFLIFNKNSTEFNQLNAKFSTCAFAELIFVNLEWKNIRENSAKINKFTRPGDLMDESD